MRIKAVLMLTLSILIATAACAQTTAAKEPGWTANTKYFVGVWRAQMDGLPAIALNITNEGGSLSGAVLFYLHRRNEGQPDTVTPGIPEPLLNLRLDGMTLIFQVSHRRAHPPATLLDAPVGYRLKLAEPNQGVLLGENENSPVTIVMTKSEY